MARPGDAHEKLNVRIRKGNTEKLKSIAIKFRCTNRYAGEEIGSIGKLLDSIAELPVEKLDAIAILLGVIKS